MAKNNYCTLVLSFRFLALSISAIKSFYSINVENIKNIKYFPIFKISPCHIYYFNNRYECFGSYFYLFSWRWPHCFIAEKLLQYKHTANLLPSSEQMSCKAMDSPKHTNIKWCPASHIDITSETKLNTTDELQGRKNIITES